ncbi:MAG: LON peptidase substrate-binding domain-containing protein [Deltaproteobacteria bacterium]|nr:MAG: LON peptidase substrate-binding domain-containing protein [Deltaproteobacteria bacterium]
MEGEATIPLFPLEVVLMPSMPLPLHIFEDRYKSMIGECLEQKKEFGVVCQEGGGMKKIGCTTRIAQILRRFDDGRLDIMTQGESRFVIQSIHEDKTYLQARVSYFDDEPEEMTDETNRLISDGIKLLEQFDIMTGTKRDYSLLSRLDQKTISFVISYNDEFTLEQKQKFLEMTSTIQRITESVQFLERLVQKAKLVQEIKEIIGGNGNLRRDVTKRLNQ